MANGVVSERFRFIWVDLPKNASSTLRGEFLLERYGGRVETDLAPAPEWEGYLVFAVLRDPLTRLLSAYQEVSLRCESGELVLPGKDFPSLPEGASRFERFLDELLDKSWDPHVRDQWQHLGGLEIDRYLRFEHLEPDLGEIYRSLGMGEVPALPHRRSRAERALKHGYRKHFLREEDLSPDLIERIGEIYRRDTELYQSRQEVRQAWSRPEVAPRTRAIEEPQRIPPWEKWSVHPLPPPASREARECVHHFSKRLQYVADIAEVPDRLIQRQPVRTRLERPFSTDPSDAQRPWYPQLSEAFLLQLEDAFIGDGVAMDGERYYGLNRWWLGDQDNYLGSLRVEHVRAAATVAGWGGEAFQLFVLGALPKLAMILELLERPELEDLKIVSHSMGADTANWFWRILGLEDRIIQKPINAEARTVIHADRVYFPEYAPTIDSYGVFARNNLLPVRQRLGVEDPGRQDLVIYVDRPYPLIRSVSNREEVLVSLEKTLRGTGYRLEVFENKGHGIPARPWDERDLDRELFGRAKIIVGPHGAGLANAVFARPGTHLIEFLPIYRLYSEGIHPRPVFWGLAQACGLTYWTSPPDNFAFLERNMVVDTGDVLEILDRVLEGGAPC